MYPLIESNNEWMDVCTACWIDICGPDGKCVKDGSNPKCQCSNDSANLLGNPKFPCFKKCKLPSYIFSHFKIKRNIFVIKYSSVN